MKYTKKLLSLVLVLVLALALAVPGMAAKITVTNPAVGQTYTAYKIFDVTKAAGANEDSGYAYTINSNSNKWWSDILLYMGGGETPVTADPGTGIYTGENITLTPTTTANVYNVSGEDLDAADFAAFLSQHTEGKDVAATNTGKQAMEDGKPAVNEDGTKKGEALELSVTDPGYYFVDSTMGALCVLNTAADEIDITEKNDEPTIDKTVTNTGDKQPSIGDTVNYKIVVTAGGKAETTYVVHDTMSSGLTLDPDSFVIKVNDLDVVESNYTINTDPADECTFDITFNETYTASLDQGTQIVITYSATLNEDAVVGVDGNTNEASLKYGNSSTTTEKTTNYVYKFDLVKTDESKNVITGAKFELYGSEKGSDKIEVIYDDELQAYRPTVEGEIAEKIEAGNVTIAGLGNGTYWLEETDAPAGYNILDKRQSITINSADNTASVLENIYQSGGVQVVNQSGGLLPETGGMGTTIFYTLGGVLVVGAAILLVTKKRVHDVEG